MRNVLNRRVVKLASPERGIPCQDGMQFSPTCSGDYIVGCAPSPVSSVRAGKWDINYVAGSGISGKQIAVIRGAQDFLSSIAPEHPASSLKQHFQNWNWDEPSGGFYCGGAKPGMRQAVINFAIGCSVSAAATPDLTFGVTGIGTGAESKKKLSLSGLRRQAIKVLLDTEVERKMKREHHSKDVAATWEDRSDF